MQPRFRGDICSHQPTLGQGGRLKTKKVTGEMRRGGGVPVWECEGWGIKKSVWMLKAQVFTLKMKAHKQENRVT